MVRLAFPELNLDSHLDNDCVSYPVIKMFILMLICFMKCISMLTSHYSCNCSLYYYYSYYTNSTHDNRHLEILFTYYFLRVLSNRFIILQLTIIDGELDNKVMEEKTVSHETKANTGTYCSINLYIISYLYLCYTNITQSYLVIHVYVYIIISNNMCPTIYLIFNYLSIIIVLQFIRKTYMYAHILFTITMLSEILKCCLSAVLLFAVHVIIIIFTTICSINIMLYLYSKYVLHEGVELFCAHGAESIEGSNNKCIMYYKKISVMIINVHLHACISIHTYSINYQDHYSHIYFLGPSGRNGILYILFLCHSKVGEFLFILIEMHALIYIIYAYMKNYSLVKYCITRLQLGLISISIYAHEDIGVCVLYNICVVEGFIHRGITLMCNPPPACTYYIMFTFADLPDIDNINIWCNSFVHACDYMNLQIIIQCLLYMYTAYAIRVMRRMRVDRKCMYMFLRREWLGYQNYTEDISMYINYYSTELQYLRTKGVLRGVGGVRSTHISVFLTNIDHG